MKDENYEQYLLPIDIAYYNKKLAIKNQIFCSGVNKVSGAIGGNFWGTVRLKRPGHGSKAETIEELMQKFGKPIQSNAKTILDLSKYILDLYSIEPVRDEEAKREILMNFIMYSSVKDPQELQGLEIIAYQIQNKDAGKQLYDLIPREREEIEKLIMRANSDFITKPDIDDIEVECEEQDIIVFMERQTGYFSVMGSQTLADELVLYMGVSEEDIKNKTNKLWYYLFLQTRDK